MQVWSTAVYPIARAINISSLGYAQSESAVEATRHTLKRLMRRHC